MDHHKNPFKNFLGTIFKDLEKIVVIATSAVILYHLYEIIIHPPGNSKLWQWLLGISIPIIVLFAFFNNLLPALRKRKELKMRPHGNPSDDYFTTSPRENDNYNFFEKGYEQYLNWLRHPKAPLLYLTGASGVGKSSLINAYLEPHLQRIQNGELTNVYVIRNYDNPLRQIQKAFSPKDHLKNYELSPYGLFDVINQHANLLANNERILIILDQFEEFFLRFSLEKEKDNADASDDRIEALKTFFNLFLSHTPKGVSMLLSYRDDRQHLIDQLKIPARNEHINFEQLKPLPYNKAKQFLTNYGQINIPNERLTKVLNEASTIEDSNDSIRPIVLNILGIIIQRMLTHPTAWKLEKKLMREYFMQGLGREVKLERAKILKILLSDYKTTNPYSAEVLAKSTNLDAFKVDNHLLVMSNYGLVRCLNKEETRQHKRIWQIAHDFIAIQLEKIIYSITPTLLRKARPWVTPILIVTIIGLGLYFYSGEKHRAINQLSKANMVWHEKSRSIFCNTPGFKITDLILKNVQDDIAFLKPDSLSLSNVWLKNADALSNLTSLSKLNLSGCYIDTIFSWSRIISGTTNVISSPTCDLDGLKNLKSLTNLDLSSGELITNLSPLANLKNLTALNLSNCSKISDLEPLKDLKKLATLNLSSCNNISNLEPLGNLVSLSTLFLSHCDSVYDLVPLKNLANLTGLNLAGCKNITNLNPLKDLKNLTSLELSYCYNISRLDAIQNLTNLTDVLLNGCVISDLAPLKNLTNLKFLSLSFCRRISNLTPIKNLNKLTNLFLSDCDSVSNLDGIQNLTNLSTLFLDNCDQLKKLDSLKNLKNLTTLVISGCDDIFDLEPLIGLPLRILDIRGCAKISKNKIEDLRNKMPYTKIMSD